MHGADFLIVGHGLAGGLLAWRLRQAGATVNVAEGHCAGAAGPVAPGLLNPLASRKLKPVWKLDTLLPELRAMLDQLQGELGQVLFHEVPMIRVLKSEAQADWLQERLKEGSDAYIKEVLSPWMLGPGVLDPYGSFITQETGWLEISSLLQALRELLVEDGCCQQREVYAQDIKWQANGGRLGEAAYGHIVFAEGWRVRANPLWHWLPWNPAIGELIELELVGEPFIRPQWQDYILNGTKWLIPMGGRTYRSGATYGWEELESGPTAAGRNEILLGLTGLVSAHFQVTGQFAGVRPVLADYRPVIGRHPEHRAAVLINGLGSKGVLFSGWVTKCLADYLISGEEIPAEISIERFITKSDGSEACLSVEPPADFDLP